MPLTMEEVAKKINVGIGTVSRVLNNSPHVSPATREKVLKEIERVGFHRNMLAYKMCKQKTSTIAIFSPGQFLILDHPNKDVVLGVGSKLTKHCYELLLHIPSEIQKRNQDPRAYSRLYQEHKVDGVIVLYPTTDDPGLKELEKHKIPSILVNSVSDQLDYVDIDNEGGTIQAVEHLIGLGHKRIGFIGGNALELADFKIRYETFRSTLLKKNIPYIEEMVKFADSGEVYTAAKEILVHGVTAIVASADWIALDTIRAAKDTGLRVPEDLSVVGFDDAQWAASFTPPLTTVRQPYLEIGKEVAGMLLRRIEENPEGHQKKSILCELVVRNSTRRIEQ